MHRQFSKGFSLIELMIAVAIVGILAAVAYPSYQEYVRDSQRAVAASCLMEIAAGLERNYAANLTYVKSGNPALANEQFRPADARARFSCLNDSTITDNFIFTFWGHRTDKDAFQARMFLGANDACGTLEIDQTGARKVDTTGRGGYSAAMVDECW